MIDADGPQATNVWPDQQANQAVDGRWRALDDVRSCLESSNYVSIRKLDCQLEDDLLVIRGTVPSYYLKQLAQELVRRLGLPQRIVNLARVEDNGKH
jgi:hypothetical protein